MQFVSFYPAKTRTAIHVSIRHGQQFRGYDVGGGGLGVGCARRTCTTSDAACTLAT